ncbi:PREDICTED: auxin-responsive protein SAUR36-like [Nelumbo nucifera]|uniref:Auxin-responsive protein SAUR36-like n=2 Tax=Nelumbo nucifera TaxID=4432 RepID=A0A1U7ZR66_NELNU|nr:PREDICTED: auxin-responsive protein SAUR36-like [Nelumbo nucifera]DAD26807.1 TPA_asm: hypothetical protein HUJ06_028275 [Nelumbo nucifera]
MANSKQTVSGSSHGRRKSSGLALAMLLRLISKRLQRGFSSVPAFRRVAPNPRGELEFDHGLVPADVKEGHFAVFAVKGEERKRFVVELAYLTDPHFLRLLSLAEEEFGFKQQGALVVPCRPDDLHRILVRGKTTPPEIS